MELHRTWCSRPLLTRASRGPFSASRLVHSFFRICVGPSVTATGSESLPNCGPAMRGGLTESTRLAGESPPANRSEAPVVLRVRMGLANVPEGECRDAQFHKCVCHLRGVALSDGFDIDRPTFSDISRAHISLLLTRPSERTLIGSGTRRTRAANSCAAVTETLVEAELFGPNAELLRAQIGVGRVCSRQHTEGPFSWMRPVKCRPQPKPSCFAF